MQELVLGSEGRLKAHTTEQIGGLEQRMGQRIAVIERASVTIKGQVVDHKAAVDATFNDMELQIRALKNEGRNHSVPAGRERDHDRHLDVFLGGRPSLTDEKLVELAQQAIGTCGARSREANQSHG